VLKYGPKLARRHTILDMLDPCTVFSIAVCDNIRYKITDAADAGKLPIDDRIGHCMHISASQRLTLKAQVYVINYTLTAVHLVGVRKMGELERVIGRFTCPTIVLVHMLLVGIVLCPEMILHVSLPCPALALPPAPMQA
jgi:hypothetical protein